jgi:arylsulfatase A-like enzyme
MIYADDLGYANPGSYGITRIPTLNCDRLTSEELRFTDAYTTAAVYNPAGYTSRYPWHT